MAEPDRRQRGAPEPEQLAWVVAGTTPGSRPVGPVQTCEPLAASSRRATARTHVHIATDDGDEPGDLSDLVAQAR